MSFIRKWLMSLLKTSHRVHLHRSVTSVAEAIGVIDRFIDGNPKYPLEWDDFISWESSLAGVERMRNEIKTMEPMFLSQDRTVRLQAHRKLIEIRNYYSTFNGIAPRSDPVADA